MSLVDTAIQNDFGFYPWLSSTQEKVIAKKYGEDVVREIREMLQYIWETAFEKNLSVSEFGDKCREIAKAQYSLLEEKTIDKLVQTLEYAFWK